MSDSEQNKAAVRACFANASTGNYDALHDAGVDVRLFNRPWNHVEDFGDFRKRVNSLDEFAWLIVNDVITGRAA